jgi:hypothetical protein
MHLTPAGFPSGIPGTGEEIEIAMQQAPQPGRQSIKKFRVKSFELKVKSNKLFQLQYIIFAFASLCPCAFAPLS